MNGDDVPSLINNSRVRYPIFGRVFGMRPGQTDRAGFKEK